MSLLEGMDDAAQRAWNASKEAIDAALQEGAGIADKETVTAEEFRRYALGLMLLASHLRGIARAWFSPENFDTLDEVLRAREHELEIQAGIVRMEAGKNVRTNL